MNLHKCLKFFFSNGLSRRLLLLKVEIIRAIGDWGRTIVFRGALKSEEFRFLWVVWRSIHYFVQIYRVVASRCLLTSPLGLIDIIYSWISLFFRISLNPIRILRLINRWDFSFLPHSFSGYSFPPSLTEKKVNFSSWRLKIANTSLIHIWRLFEFIDFDVHR